MMRSQFNANQNKLPDLILGLVFFITICVITFYISSKRAEEDQLRFEYEANFLTRKIQSRMESYEGALIGIRAYLRNAHILNKSNLSSYTKDTEIFKRLPGLQGLGYVGIKRNELRTRKIINDHLMPNDLEYIQSSIMTLEPENWNHLQAIGYDLSLDPKNLRAMEKARDNNQATMTEQMFLPEEMAGKKIQGFFIYLPHYKIGSDLSTIEKRREALLGFVFSPFKTDLLFKAIFSEINMILDVNIYDNSHIEKNLLFHHLKKNTDSIDKIQRSIYFDGRNLLLNFTKLPSFPNMSSIIKDFFVFITGCLIAGIIAWIYFLTKKQMKFANMMATEKSTLLDREKEHVAARDHFLSIASHELKTPLTSLKLQVQSILRSIHKKDPSVFTPEKLISLVKQIDNQTSRLTRLVDDMLDISRIKTGKLQMEICEVNMNEMVLDVLERLKPQIQTMIGVLPKVNLNKKIIGHWDRFRIEQVIINLMTNAIRYGNGKPIKVKTSLRGNRAKIIIQDQGIGISQDNLIKIFDRFERAGISSHEISGLGLGLFISKEIVHAHKGKIYVLSQKGKGSTFIVELPLFS
jgi:two-component system OmpR family sensor kinase